MDPLIVTIGIVGLIFAYVIYTYNSFVALRNRAGGSWSDIDVQLRRRHDLIPNLVEIVRGYAKHEKTVFEDVARLRSQAMNVQGIEAKDGAENQFAGAIKSLFAITESYPELRADSNFRDLQTQLTEVEDNIQSARRYYNAVVRDLNTKCETFPSGIIGGWFGMERMPYFQIGDEAREPVRANFTAMIILLLLLIVAKPVLAWDIADYNIRMDIQSDSSVYVSETIQAVSKVL